MVNEDIFQGTQLYTIVYWNQFTIKTVIFITNYLLINMLTFNGMKPVAGGYKAYGNTVLFPLIRSAILQQQSGCQIKH